LALYAKSIGSKKAPHGPVPQTLPLKDHEVVLIFDDGPLFPSTNKVLDALAAQCVQANFFIVGERAKASPKLVQRAYEDGHAIGTHSHTHTNLAQLPLADAEKEIGDGFYRQTPRLAAKELPLPFFVRLIWQQPLA
jgi:peptidoglycan/xylan/chitin deacetylase (PgdA/CDA1 family)